MSQGFNYGNWKSHSSNLDPITKYCHEHCSATPDNELSLINKTLEDPNHRMLGSADEIHMLADICRAMGAKKTLDIGVYTGFSALCVAKALPDNGKVVACDITDKYLNEFCNPAWTEAGVRHKIDFRVGPATETLESLVEDGQNGTFDFAFIDADKVNYQLYYELCLKLIRRGGIIAFDNVLLSGRVLEGSGDDRPDSVAIRKLNQFLKSDERVKVTMLNLADGTSIVLKL